MVKPAYKPLSHQDNIISIVIIARLVAVHFRLEIFIMTYFYHLLWNHWDIHGNNFPGIFQLCMSTLHNKNKSHFQTLANLKLCMLLLNRLVFFNFILTTKDKAMTSLLCCWRKAVDVQSMCGFALSCWSIKPDKFDAFYYFLPSRKHDFYEVAWSQTQASHFHQVKNRSFCWTQQSWARNV